MNREENGSGKSKTIRTIDRTGIDNLLGFDPMINCFCMFSNYQPMTLDEWIVIDRERRKKQE